MLNAVNLDRLSAEAVSDCFRLKAALLARLGEHYDDDDTSGSGSDDDGGDGDEAKAASDDMALSQSQSQSQSQPQLLAKATATAAAGANATATEKEVKAKAALAAAVRRNTKALDEPYQLLDHPEVLRIARARAVAGGVAGGDAGGAAEVLLKWALQQEPPVAVIPKSVSPSHIRRNAAALRAPELSDADLAALDALEVGHKFCWDPSLVS